MFIFIIKKSVIFPHIYLILEVQKPYDYFQRENQSLFIVDNSLSIVFTIIIYLTQFLKMQTYVDKVIITHFLPSVG